MLCGLLAACRLCDILHTHGLLFAKANFLRFLYYHYNLGGQLCITYVMVYGSVFFVLFWAIYETLHRQGGIFFKTLEFGFSLGLHLAPSLGS